VTTDSYVRHDSFSETTYSYVWHDSFSVTTDSYVWHDSFSETTYSYVWHDSFSEMTYSYVWHDSFLETYTSLVFRDPLWCSGWCVKQNLFICVTRLIHMCEMTHSYVSHMNKSFFLSRMSRLIHMCKMTYSYVWLDSFICAKWLMHMCDMTRFQRHTKDPLWYSGSRLKHLRGWVISQTPTWMSHVTHTRVQVL